LLQWIKSLFSGKPADERMAELERQAQSLRLDLEEQEQVAAQIKKELDRLHGVSNAQVAEAVQAQVERLLSDAATPVVQLLTQAYLLENDRPVQARDVLAVARRLVRVLQDNGLTVEGSVGERVPFDPDHHEPLSADVSLQAGQMVVVRFVGLAYRGRLLRKASVEQGDSSNVDI
jgi:molecular chaperone GrpE (heat shock protein)